MRRAVSVMALAAALAAGSANAADLPSRKEAPVYVPPPVFSWTGFYAGLNLGGSWIDRRNDWSDSWWLFTPTPFTPFGIAGLGTGAFPFLGNNNGSNGGVSGGLQGGYNYQVSPLFVVGFETDFQGTSIGSHNNNWWGGWGGGESVPWFGTVRGRLGVALLDSRLLIYGTGGFAYGEVHRPSLWWSGNNNNIKTGWTAGGGVEYAFLPNWSAKVEYLYAELSNNNNDGWWGWGSRRQTRLNTVRAGVNYHFNLFTPTPVVARY